MPKLKLIFRTKSWPKRGRKNKTKKQKKMSEGTQVKSLRKTKLQKFKTKIILANFSE